MKTLLTTLLFSAILIIGCADDSSFFTSPDSSVNENVNLEKKTKRDTTGYQVYTVSKEINGDLGGFIYLGEADSAFDGQGVYAAIYFPAGSFSGTETITMTLDPEDLSGTFSPGMVFNTPVSFSALFTGLNLHGRGSSNMEFVYVAPNGEETVIPNSFLYIDREKGVVGILHAQLPHFSRYGFTR